MPLAARAALACALLLPLAPALIGCQDPSGVGLELIGEEGADPNTIVVPASSAERVDEPDFTGGFANRSPEQTRVLVGRVTDAIGGETEAQAYFDVVAPSSVPAGYADRALTSATLRLARDYVYGDSSVTIPATLYGFTRTWNPVGAPIDTTFEAGPAIASYDLPASDTLVTLALPAAWLTANGPVLRSDSIATAFRGFTLRVDDGATPGAIVGFDATRSRLRLTTAEDTVDYPLLEVFTAIAREGGADPAESVVIRDGAGEALALSFALADSLAGRALASAVLRVDLDPSVYPLDGVFRSRPEELALFARTADSTRVFVAVGRPVGTGTTYSFASSAFTRIVQGLLLGEATYERFEVEFSPTPASVSVFPIRLAPPAPGEPDRRPRLALTVVPASR